MDFFKVWQWPQQLASLAASLVLLAAAGWYVDRRLEAHYTTKVRAEFAENTREARVIQSKANTAATAGLQASKAKDSKTLELELAKVAKYAETLPADVACRADAAFIGMLNAGGRARQARD